jgi:predicted MFS family arabinose efflux permease
MPHRKLGWFVLEGINSFATTFFFYYLPFVMKEHYGFTNRDNLLLTTLHGGVYVFASWQGGRLAQRLGYFWALRAGYLGMALALIFGLLVTHVAGQIVAVVCWTFPLCLTWPTLEALASQGETRQGTARMVGIYNLVWAAGSAVAFNSGGWLLQKLGGTGFTQRQILFGIAALFMMLQFVLAVWLERQARNEPPVQTPLVPAHSPEASAFQQPIPPKRFLQLAWFANPFAYVAMNTLTALLPQLAGRFELTTAQVGLVFSIWPYARAVAFVALWQWTGWHYRFRWLMLAFVGLIASFATMLLAPQLWMVILAELTFGAAVGLLYYSSLFYSMDAGEAKGEHGGLHEAALGLGIFAGPALGAATLTLVPQQPASGALAVTALLLTGFGGLVWLRIRGGK